MVNPEATTRRRSRCLLWSVFLLLVLGGVGVLAIYAINEFQFGKDDDDPADSDDTNTVTIPTSSPVPPTPTARPTPGIRHCNGLPNLCAIPVNEILFATMHNANADSDTVRFGFNHNQGIGEGLRAGIRGLNMDIGLCTVDGTPQLAMVHALCGLGFSDPRTVFTEIHQFLTDNPHEVILMPIQINDDTGGGTVSLREIYQLMDTIVDARGTKILADRLYVHPPNATSWPTLEELIDADTRILLFVYNGAETCAGLGADCPPGFHDWFVYAAETQFQFVNIESILQDPVRACTITRGGGGTRDFFGINVFLQIPNAAASTRLNSASFLQSHLETCSSQNDLSPNLVLVDFWHEGDLLSVVENLNRELSANGSETL